MLLGAVLTALEKCREVGWGEQFWQQLRSTGWLGVGGKETLEELFVLKVMVCSKSNGVPTCTPCFSVNP